MGECFTVDGGYYVLITLGVLLLICIIVKLGKEKKMGEFVEKKEVIDAVKDMAISGECCVGTDPRSQYMGKLAILKAIDKVKKIPVRYGEWKIDGRNKICSECGARNSSRYKNFCPNCGVEMKK